MGIFTQAAGGLAAREEGQYAATERARQEAENKIRMASMIAALGHANIVPDSQRETVNPTPLVPGLHGSIATPAGAPPGAALVLPKTPNLEQTQTPGVDQSRYTKLGDSGFSLDETPKPDFAERRALQLHEQKISQRVAALRARNPQYKSMEPDALRGIAEDDTTYSEALKTPPAPHTVPTSTGIMRWDGATQTFVPTGMDSPVGRPATINTKDGIKSWNAKTQKFELMKDDKGGAEMPFVPPRRPPATGSGNAPITEDDRRRVALNQRLAGLERQITATQKDIDRAALADDSDKPTGKARTAALQARADSLRTVSDSLNKELGATVERQSSGAALERAGVKPVAPSAGGGRSSGGQPSVPPAPTVGPLWLHGVKLDVQGAPEGLDLSADARASQEERDKALAAVNALQRGVKGLTLAGLLSSPSLTAAQKAIAWKKISVDSAAALGRAGH